MRMRRYMGAALALAVASSAGAVDLGGLQGFEPLFGRYGPGGDCGRFPQVVVAAPGISLDQGQGKVEQVRQVEYAASWFGGGYQGIAMAFLPQWPEAGGNPVVVVVNAGEREGTLEVEPQDFGWKGGPPMPARFQPWLKGSPYVRCAGS